MVAHKKYKERVSASFNTDRELLKQFTEQCRKQGLTVSESVTALIKESLQKNQVWAANPISVNYNYTDTGFKHTELETLDHFIENNAFTAKYWHEYYNRINDIDRLARHEALSLTINNQAKQRRHYLKTGKYLVQ